MAISQQEFENNYNKSKDKFIAYVYSLVRNLTDAEDILQEAFAKMTEKIDSYDPSKPFEAWAMGFVKMQVLRHKQNKARDRLSLVEFTDEILSPLSDDAIADETFRLKQENMYSIIEKGMKKLSPFLAQLIKMKYQKGMSNAEIATELGKNVGSIEMGLTRARRELKDFVSQQEKQVTQTEI